MKKELYFVFFNVILFSSQAQLAPATTHKICLDENTSSIRNIGMQKDMLVCKTVLGRVLSGFR